MGSGGSPEEAASPIDLCSLAELCSLTSFGLPNRARILNPLGLFEVSAVGLRVHSPSVQFGGDTQPGSRVEGREGYPSRQRYDHRR